MLLVPYLRKKDADGVLSTREAMIRWGMALNLNSICEERRLSPELQNIIKNYRDKFDGSKVGCGG